MLREMVQVVAEVPPDGTRGQRGMVRIIPTGPQVVTCLIELVIDVHPGRLGDDYPDQEAIVGRVYDDLTRAIDETTMACSAADPALEVVVDDTIASRAP